MALQSSSNWFRTAPTSTSTSTSCRMWAIMGRGETLGNAALCRSASGIGKPSLSPKRSVCGTSVSQSELNQNKRANFVQLLQREATYRPEVAPMRSAQGSADLWATELTLRIEGPRGRAPYSAQKSLFPNTAMDPEPKETLQPQHTAQVLPTILFFPS